MTKRSVPPWVWIFLNLPFGATSGFVSVTLGYLLTHPAKGPPASDVTVGSLVALNLLPHTWKAFWAPVADATLTRKRWYLLGNIPSCLTILAIAATPITISSLGILRPLIFINSLAITFVGMAVEGLMAHATSPEERGRAAGWFQAGNLGGAGVGGGLALVLAQHINTQVAFIAIAALLGACSLALKFVPDAPHEGGDGDSPLARMKVAFVSVAKDVWGVMASRRGIVALVLCFLPIGSAAASGLFSAMSDTWQANADVVALTTGTLGGIVSAVGCVAGGWMSDRMRRAVAYAISGAILAAIAVGMAFFPKNVWTYATYTLLYMFASGIAYACFTGFVLEVIGKGAAATKYNVLASLSNIPITYMTIVLSHATEGGEAQSIPLHAVIAQPAATTLPWQVPLGHAFALPWDSISEVGRILTRFVEYGRLGWVENLGYQTLLLWDAASEIIGIVILLVVVLIVRPGRTPLPPGEALEVNRETDR